MKAPQLPIKDVVLIGGGHAHVQVLKQFAMRPVEGARFILISDRSFAPYSGMLPGYLAGWYSFFDIHFDLRQICQRSNAVFILDTVTGVNPQTQEVTLAHRPPLKYDIASINVGSSPYLPQKEKVENLFLLKPIAPFLKAWQKFLKIIEDDGPPLQIALVGGGASGTEVAMIVNHQVQKKRPGSKVCIFESSPNLLSHHHPQAQKKILKILLSQGIQIHCGWSAVYFDGVKLYFKNHPERAFDFVFWATHAAAPQWMAQSKLPANHEGFLQVQPNLAVKGFTNLFGAGDCVDFFSHPLPKSGVYAVRQGKILAQNIRLVLLNQKPQKKYKPQKNALALITLGEKKALASRGPIVLTGQLLWNLKDFIDRRFMDRFQNYFVMAPKKVDQLPLTPKLQPNTCGGCGCKLSPMVLSRLMQKLPVGTDDSILIGLKEPDDAAVVQNPLDSVRIETIDFFKPFDLDLYFFGQITALHALNDVYAMGAIAQTALALVTIPQGPKVDVDLFQMMAGAHNILAREKVQLVGGHSVEGKEIGLGFSVSGYGKLQKIWKKSTPQIGDALILTKPLGTGLILAGHMQGLVRGDWIDYLYEKMLISHREIVSVLSSAEVHAATDISGFGFLGHLLEMLKPRNLSAQIYLDALPIYPGFLELFQKGVRSSLSQSNYENVRTFIEPIAESPLELLVDPQTCGGLLLAISKENLSLVLSQLKHSGLKDSVCVGQVIDGPTRIYFGKTQAPHSLI